jgi:hypothetical protein
LLVFHSSQTAVHASHQYIHFKTKQKLYWHCIAEHPAHAGKFMADWIPEAHEQALVLHWCSFGALATEFSTLSLILYLAAMTSSTAQIPFPLKPSQDLENMLTSLEAKNRPDNAWGGEGRGRVYSRGNSSRRADHEPDEKHDSELVHNAPVATAETVAQARYTLRTTLIDKVLIEKCCHINYFSNCAPAFFLIPYRCSSNMKSRLVSALICVYWAENLA